MPRSDECPAFLFYPDDFAGDGRVEVMTTEEVGAYILLICKAWREKPVATIPADDRVLARWARMTPEHWQESKAAVLNPWRLVKDGTRYVQPRLEKEYKQLLTQRRQRQQCATTAAEARWARERAMRDASRPHSGRNNSAMRNDAISSSSSSSSSSSPPDAGGFGLVPGVLNSDAGKAAWSAWECHLRESGRRITSTQIRAFSAKLEFMGSERAIASIETTIAAGLTGLIESSTASNSFGERETQADRTRRLLEKHQMDKSK